MFEDMEGIQGRENNVFNKWCLDSHRRVMGRGGEIAGAMKEIMYMINKLSISYGDVYIGSLYMQKHPILLAKYISYTSIKLLKSLQKCFKLQCEKLEPGISHN